MAGSLDFFQIIYKQEQQKDCYPFARVHFNNELTHFFENSVIERLVLGSRADKISVCSWKLREKMRWNVCRPRPLTEEVLKTDYDVLSFTCNTKYHQMLAAADKWHAGFRSIIEKILEAMGEKLPSEVKSPVYQNHFSASSQVYKEYVTTWLTPAMNIMDNDPDINKMCWADSGYSQLAQRDAATPEYLKEKIGVPYYPLFPFLLERLFSIFCHNKKIRVTYL
jgi:hypothetical protein